MGSHDEAVLQWNVVEFVKDVVRLGTTASISHDLVPGGSATADEAVKQGLVVITTKKETLNTYQLTFQGLMLYWSHADTSEVFLISRKVAN